MHIFCIVGRLCERAESAAASNIRDTCGSMEQYIAEIRKEEPVCADGEPGTFTWTPDDNTPDVVYYQVSEKLISILVFLHYASRSMWSMYDNQKIHNLKMTVKSEY